VRMKRPTGNEKHAAESEQEEWKPGLETFLSCHWGLSVHMMVLC